MLLRPGPAFWLVVRLPRLSARRLYSSSPGPLSPEHLLSESHRRTVLDRLSQARPLRPTRPSPSSGPALRQAAVLVPLCVSGGRVCLLYTRRSAGLRRNSREVSFPGGLADEDDEGERGNPAATALRETQEELGIDPKNVDVWGVMPQLSDKHGKTAVTPVLGRIIREPDTLSSLRVNRDEVSDVFTLSLSELSDPRTCRFTQFRPSSAETSGRPKGYTMPVYDTQPFKIWGLTAIITYQLLSILLPKDATARHRLKFVAPIKLDEEVGTSV